MPNILLVDDEERFVKSLHTILQYYNYQCTEAFSGSETIRLLKEMSFDLILLDVQLPDMSGCDLLKFIKASCKNTIVIMLTGISAVETAVQAMKQGAYDFLNKPINHELLIKTIEKGLQHQKLMCELEVSEERFQTLAEAAWEGIVIHESGRLLVANSQFYAMFGYTEQELVQTKFLEKILSPVSWGIVSQHIECSFFGSFEITGVKKDGTEFPLETNSRPINYRGRPARVCALRDLSERVRVEKEKLALHKKLAKDNSLKELGKLAGFVAHDLNNILSGVVSYPDLLLSQMDTSDKFYEKIKRIQEAGKRAATVVADLLVLARGGTSLVSVENINDIILNHLSSIEHCERMLNYPGVTIKTDLQQNLCNTCCSQKHIHKILLNLIGNALEAVQGNGMICISTRNCRPSLSATMDYSTAFSEGYVKISLEDNGPGIAAKDIDHIFEPFYSTKIMGKSGSGLGLAIVRNAVLEHHGWIEVKNRNPGVVFEIYLPVTLEKMFSADHDDVNGMPRGNGESILLIDDELEQNEIMGKLIGSLGYKNHSVLSGEEGIAFLKSNTVDLVLIDMIMGDGLNGCETYEQILRIKPDQKAIIVSGYSRKEDIQKANALGITMFLGKPVTLSKLSQAIRQSLYPATDRVVAAGG